MNKRLFWIGMVVMGLAACGGDDDSSSSSKSNASANNLSSNGSANNSTNSVENNGPDADAGGDSAFADANSGFDGTNNNTSNSSNNTTSTNNSTSNSTNNIATGVACMDILQCLLVCNTEDEVCRQDCKDMGSPAAHRKIDAYLGCVDTACAHATGATELTECVLAKCSAEQAACLE